VRWDTQTGFIDNLNPFNRYVDTGVVDPVITELTGITTQMLVYDGLLPKQALTEFWAFLGTATPMAWGGDVGWLREASEREGVPVPKQKRGIDLKGMSQIMRLAIPGKTRGGLLSTMNAFGLQFEGTQHRAVDDAYNAARLAALWLKESRHYRAICATFAP
jgi:inhibitor of KinA sporulation pathway (predicted exonuclease)